MGMKMIAIPLAVPRNKCILDLFSVAWNSVRYDVVAENGPVNLKFEQS